MQTRLHQLLPPNLLVLGAAGLAVTSLAVAYALMWWTRGIALPLLFLIGASYWLLTTGEPGRRQRVAVRAWLIAVGFFLIGPLVIDLFRLALLAVALLLAFKPGGPP